LLALLLMLASLLGIPFFVIMMPWAAPSSNSATPTASSSTPSASSASPTPDYSVSLGEQFW
jgi:hypothetical protein